MPTYPYKCNNCDYKFEVSQSIKEYKELRKCPQCHQLTLKRLFNIKSGFVKLADSEIKTVGHLAQRNRERMSKDQRDELQRKHNEYKLKPPEHDPPSGMSYVPRKIKSHNK